MGTRLATFSYAVLQIFKDITTSAVLKMYKYILRSHFLYLQSKLWHDQLPYTCMCHRFIMSGAKNLPVSLSMTLNTALDVRNGSRCNTECPRGLLQCHKNNCLNQLLTVIYLVRPSGETTSQWGLKGLADLVIRRSPSCYIPNPR